MGAVNWQSKCCLHQCDKMRCIASIAKTLNFIVSGSFFSFILLSTGWQNTTTTLAQNTGRWTLSPLIFPVEEITNFFLLKAFISPEVKLCCHHGYFIIKLTRGIFYCRITGESKLASSIQTHITTRHLTSWVEARPSASLIPPEMGAFTLLQLFSAELCNGFLKVFGFKWLLRLAHLKNRSNISFPHINIETISKVTLKLQG